jgi:hypothetical protein
MLEKYLSVQDMLAIEGIALGVLITIIKLYQFKKLKAF